jgi:hypothetical protein
VRGPSRPGPRKVSASPTRSLPVASPESRSRRKRPRQPPPRTSESQDFSLQLNESRQEAGRRTRVRRPRETNGHPRAGSPLMDRSWRACPTATSRFTLGNSQVSRSDGTPFAGCHLLACAELRLCAPQSGGFYSPFAIDHPKGSSFGYAHSPSGLSVRAHQLLPPESGASTAPDVPRRGPSHSLPNLRHPRPGPGRGRDHASSMDGGFHGSKSRRGSGSEHRWQASPG